MKRLSIFIIMPLCLAQSIRTQEVAVEHHNELGPDSIEVKKPNSPTTEPLQRGRPESKSTPTLPSAESTRPQLPKSTLSMPVLADGDTPDITPEKISESAKAISLIILGAKPIESIRKFSAKDIADYFTDNPEALASPSIPRLLAELNPQDIEVISKKIRTTQKKLPIGKLLELIGRRRRQPLSEDAQKALDSFERVVIERSTSEELQIALNNAFKEGDDLTGVLIAKMRPEVIKADSYGYLDKAIKTGSIATLKAIIEIIAKDPKIFINVIQSDPKLVSTFIKAGANVNARGSREWTPLMFIAQLEPSSQARVTILFAALENLIDAGADVNAQALEGYTALMIATMHNTTPQEIIKLLITSGAQIDARTDSGRTALMIAAQEGNINAVQALLEAGADPQATDLSRKKSVLDYASKTTKPLISAAIEAKKR